MKHCPKCQRNWNVDGSQKCPYCDCDLADGSFQVQKSKCQVSTVSGTEAEVCNDIAVRQAIGISKYGTSVATNPLDLKAWLQHAYEESIDQAIYLKRAINEIEANQRKEE